jgi:hypothetical protein
LFWTMTDFPGMLIIDLSFFDYSSIHMLKMVGWFVNHLSQSWWIACLDVVFGLVTRGKRAYNVCADNLTFIVSSHLAKKKPLIHHLDNSCHLHTNGGNRTLRENFGRHLNSDLILVKPDGRYTIRRWRQIWETNTPKDRRAMKRLSALFTLPYCKIFI